MLSLIAGKLWELKKSQDLITHVSDIFSLFFEDEWFEPEWARDMIQDVDRISLEPNVLVVDTLAQNRLRPEDLCGGTKAVMTVAYTDYLVSMLMMGENCYKYLFRAIYGRDKRMALTSYCQVRDSDFHGDVVYLENTGDYARTSWEFELFFTRLGGMFG